MASPARALPPDFFLIHAPRTSFLVILAFVVGWLALVTAALAASSGTWFTLPTSLGLLTLGLVAGACVMNMKERGTELARVWKHGGLARARVLDAQPQGRDHTGAYLVRYHFEAHDVACLHVHRTWRAGAADLSRGDAIDVVYSRDLSRSLPLLSDSTRSAALARSTS